MILSGRRSAGAEESIEVLLANRRRGRPNEASRLHGALIVVLFAFPAIEVRVHPARRGVAHPPCWLQIPSARGDLAQLSSSGTPVVVMEPTEYGDCVDAAVRLQWTRNRLLVPEGLVRTRFVVETDVLGDEAPEVILTEDDDVVEHLSAERAGEAFSEGIHVRCTYRRAHDAHPRRSEYASEPSAELRVMVADNNLWFAVQGGVPGLLRAPLVGRRICHRGMEDSSATQVQKEEHEHLAEPHVERLNEVTRPRHVVSQERRPAVPVASGSRARRMYR